MCADNWVFLSFVSVIYLERLVGIAHRLCCWKRENCRLPVMALPGPGWRCRGRSKLIVCIEQQFFLVMIMQTHFCLPSGRLSFYSPWWLNHLRTELMCSGQSFSCAIAIPVIVIPLLRQRPFFFARLMIPMRKEVTFSLVDFTTTTILKAGVDRSEAWFSV